jgi:hypothetical protein
MTQTGPRSARAKRRVSTNAVRHGLRSTKVVIPGLERQADWETFLEDSIKALDPQGAVEYALAERITTLLWRLRRAPRAERDSAIRANNATVEEGDPLYKNVFRLLEGFRKEALEQGLNIGFRVPQEGEPGPPPPRAIAQEKLREPAVLPEPLELRNLSQYEYRLSRQLLHALHELQALQDRRLGRAAPLVRVAVDHEGGDD